MCLFRLELSSTVCCKKALCIYYMILGTGTSLCKFQQSLKHSTCFIPGSRLIFRVVPATRWATPYTMFYIIKIKTGEKTTPTVFPFCNLIQEGKMAWKLKYFNHEIQWKTFSLINSRISFFLIFIYYYP